MSYRSWRLCKAMASQMVAGSGGCSGWGRGRRAPVWLPVRTHQWRQSDAAIGPDGQFRLQLRTPREVDLDLITAAQAVLFIGCRLELAQGIDRIGLEFRIWRLLALPDGGRRDTLAGN